MSWNGHCHRTRFPSPLNTCELLPKEYVERDPPSLSTAVGLIHPAKQNLFLHDWGWNEARQNTMFLTWISKRQKITNLSNSWNTGESMPICIVKEYERALTNYGVYIFIRETPGACHNMSLLALSLKCVWKATYSWIPWFLKYNTLT